EKEIELEEKKENSVLSQYTIPNTPIAISIISTNEYNIYQIHEPKLSPTQKETKKTLQTKLVKYLTDKTTYHHFLRNLDRELRACVKQHIPSANPTETDTLTYHLKQELRGYGELHPYIEDQNITSIIIATNAILVQHKKHGLLVCPPPFERNEILSIIKKQLRKVARDNTTLPQQVLLDSEVMLRIPENQTIASITIGILEKQKSSNTKQITSYTLSNELIQVTITKTKEHCVYHPSFQPFSHIEKELLKQVQNKNTKNLLSEHAFANYVYQNYPLISQNKYASLYSAYHFAYDKTEWIKLIASDPCVTRLLCSAPGTPIQIWHRDAPGGAVTTISPSRDDLHQLAKFLLSAAKEEIKTDKTDYLLQFETGERVSLKKQRDEQGYYYQIDIIKDHKPENGNKNREQKKTSFNTISFGAKSDGTISLKKIQSIDASLNKIFARKYDHVDFDKSDAEKKEKETLEDIKKPLSDENVQQEDGSENMEGAAFEQVKKLLSKKTQREEKAAHNTPDEAPYDPPSNEIPPFIPLPPGYRAENTYWLVRPYAYAVIVQDRKNELYYWIIEPKLSSKEQILLEQTHETLRDVLIYDVPREKGTLFLEYQDVARVVRAFNPLITPERLGVLYYYLKRNLRGYGKIDPLMHDEYLEDISCNGHGIPVYIYHRLHGSIPTKLVFKFQELNRFVLKLAQKADRQVSLTTPLLDASLPNGSRAQITYTDVVSTKGSSFTIRKFRSDPMTPATLLSFETYNDEILAFIWLALENRQSLIIVGGTASGKTSTMNAFAFFIPHHSKIVSLEDTREIQIPQKNWLPVQTRTTASVSNRGDVDLFDLLKASLRQRPEYIIVGEVRGSEAQTLFQAMNSGHTTLSTLHAGNIEETLNRLTNEPINVPKAMFGALKLIIIQTLHYRDGKMVRRCDAVHELLISEGDKLEWNTLYEYDPDGDTFKTTFETSSVLSTLQYMHNWSKEEITYQLKLRTAFLARVREMGITDPHHLISMITELRKASQDMTWEEV
ncbi:MAG: type II/IV secretion system ATPase subunit, partial [Methanomicrobiales archaeon]|nr:type II/IV secretion system ATPase subunit [Methanomicrobiales archaeon]